MFRRNKTTALIAVREDSLARKLKAGGELGQNKQVLLVLERENMSNSIEVLQKKRAKINNTKNPPKPTEPVEFGERGRTLQDCCTDVTDCASCLI